MSTNNKLLEAAKYALQCLESCTVNTGDTGDQAYQALKEAIAEAEQQEEDTLNLRITVELLQGQLHDWQDRYNASVERNVILREEVNTNMTAYNTACSKIDELNERIAEQDNEIRRLQNDYEEMINK